MAYARIGFVNDNPPAINAENLNKMDNELVLLDSAYLTKDITARGNLGSVDLDTIITPGVYWKSSSVTVSHAPSDIPNNAAFVLTVYKTNNTSAYDVVQTIVRYGTDNPKLYVRGFKTTSAFGTWATFVRGTDLDSALASLARDLGCTRQYADQRVDFIADVAETQESFDISKSAYVTKLTGKNADVSSSGIVISNSAYVTSYVWVVNRPTKIYFEAPFPAYLSICYGTNFTGIDNVTYKCSNAQRKRNSDSNLPTTPETAISLNVGDIIIVSVTINKSAYIYGLQSKYEFSDEMEKYIKTVTEDTKKAVDAMIKEDSAPYRTDLASSQLFTKKAGMSADVSSNSIFLNSLASYDSYVYVLEQSASIYFEQSNVAYVSICYGTDYTSESSNQYYCTSPVRKRKADSNLPTTPEAAISLSAGDIIIITVTKDKTVGIYGLEGNFVFTDKAKGQISEIANVKRSKVIYNDTTSSGETERLYIYIPSGVGYVKYNFAHFVNEQINSNVWLIHPLDAVSDELAYRFALTTSGEFECALRIADRSDFMGGSAHGSEIMQSITFFVDGAEISPNDLTELTEFDVLRIVEQSKLFDPADETTFVALHGKEYIFTKEKLIINQTIVWQVPEELTPSYLAMLPVAKTVTSKLVIDKDYAIRNLPDILSTTGVQVAISWKDTVGFSARFSKTKWEIKGTGLTGTDSYICTDNNGGDYNKQYFTCCTGGNVSANDVWKTTTEYIFQINK